MKKQITANQAYSAYVTTKHGDKPLKVAQSVIINGCPDCLGTGKQNKRTCPTCGGEKDS
jgi:DnaJ-class molecular chaperone